MFLKCFIKFLAINEKINYFHSLNKIEDLTCHAHSNMYRYVHEFANEFIQLYNKWQELQNHMHGQFLWSKDYRHDYQSKGVWLYSQKIQNPFIFCNHSFILNRIISKNRAWWNTKELFLVSRGHMPMFFLSKTAPLTCTYRQSPVCQATV